MAEPLITLEQLKQRLGWADVEIDPYEAETVFYVVPREPACPRMHLLFSDECDYFLQLGWSHWHAHFDRYHNPSRSARAGITAARALIRQTRCLVEELGSDDRYLGGMFMRPAARPLSLHKNVAKLRRFFFDRPPRDEEIDFSRYYRCKTGGYVEHGWRERLLAVYAEQCRSTHAL